MAIKLPPGQQLVAPGKWPMIGEKEPASVDHEWSLAISGAVENPIVFTLDQLTRLPQTRQTIDIHCVTRWSKLGVVFEGVSLADLLKLACPDPAARFISFASHSTRKHSTSLSLEVALNQKTLIATRADGASLAVEHGGPIRNIVPGRYFYKSVKWLNQLELLTEDRLGFWEAESGYHNEADPWCEQRYIASQLDRREVAELLESKDFSGRDLMGISANKRQLPGLNARDAKLRNADFSHSELSNADFRLANLSNADLRSSRLHGVDFREADLEGANFSGADLRGADLRNSSLIGSSFTEVVSGANLEAIFDQQTRFSEASIILLFPEQLDFVRRKCRESGAVIEGA